VPTWPAGSVRGGRLLGPGRRAESRSQFRSAQSSSSNRLLSSSISHRCIAPGLLGGVPGGDTVLAPAANALNVVVAGPGLSLDVKAVLLMTERPTHAAPHLRESDDSRPVAAGYFFFVIAIFFSASIRSLSLDSFNSHFPAVASSLGDLFFAPSVRVIVPTPESAHRRSVRWRI